MSRAPLVSVIMPVYNSEDYVKEAIDSILKQSFTDFELIIVDDYSEDNSLNIIQKFRDPRIKVLRNHSNRGISVSLNKAIANSRGKYIARMDSDDVSVETRLEEQVKFMDENSDIDVCGSWYRNFGNQDYVNKLFVEDPLIKIAMLFYNHVCHPSVIFRSNSFNSNRIYDPDLRESQDYALWASKLKSHKFHNIPHVLLKNRVHSKSISASNSQKQQEKARSIKRSLLKDFGLEPSEEEFRIHNLISGNLFKVDKVLHQNVDSWLAKINESNTRKDIWDPDLLSTFLVGLWKKSFQQLDCKEADKIQLIEESLFLSSKLKKIYKNFLSKINKEKSVSVVVCTYNRSDLLKNCLESVTEQSIKDTYFDVIVVNNNSSDNTHDVARLMSYRYPFVKVEWEDKQGLSIARNRGFLSSNSEYIAYLDDDAQVGKDWLKKAVKLIKSKKPDILGGPIYPFYKEPKPEWFRDKYEIRLHQKTSGWMKDGSYISASNFIIKRHLLKEYNGFDPNLGMKGDKIKYGEEVQIIRRALKEGKKVYYSLNLIVEHLVPEFKMHLGYFFHRLFNSGKSSAAIDSLSANFIELKNYPGLIDKTLSQFERSFKDVDKNRYSYPENYLVEEVLPNFHTIGRITYAIKENYNSDILSYIFFLSLEKTYIRPKVFVLAILRLTKVFLKGLINKVRMLIQKHKNDR